jgi:hypothetical protein
MNTAQLSSPEPGTSPAGFINPRRQKHQSSCPVQATRNFPTAVQAVSLRNRRRLPAWVRFAKCSSYLQKWQRGLKMWFENAGPLSGFFPIAAPIGGVRQSFGQLISPCDNGGLRPRAPRISLRPRPPWSYISIWFAGLPFPRTFPARADD